MLHPRLTPLGATIGGASSQWLAQVGPYGAWSDLQVNMRWGEGASGMFELQWTMPLSPDFEHPLLRRGTLVEIMDGPWRIGSPLILSEPARGTGLDQPWQFVAAGIGREADGFYALDGSGNATNVPATAVDAAIARPHGLRWSGRGTTVPTSALGTIEGPETLASQLSAAGDLLNQRWLVGQDNLVGFRSDPTTPTYQVVPGAAALGTADDNYATVVLFRYLDSTSHLYQTVAAFDPVSPAEALFGRREYLAEAPGALGEISAATAQSMADGILAKSKGRLAWTNGLTGLTSNQILTMGGVPADLSKVLEDVGEGCMVRLHGIWSDLLAYNGQTYLDIVIGEARYTDGAQTIDLSPMGLAARDLLRVVEDITGNTAA